MTAPLAVAFEGDRTLRFTRSFAAPRPLVWRAFTEPELITQWLWARSAPMTLCEQDFRVGGHYRWGWALPRGGLMAVSGRFLEIAPPEKIVHTELFDEDWTGGETTVTTFLLDEGPATRMEMTVLYATPEARDRAAATPMAEGMEEGYARLDTLLPGWA
ncbi:MAG: SRPBCC family protein [Paracoccaceae bacterium]|nr:SRPBCC family protein [Paracoccaceae bacterium]